MEIKLKRGVLLVIAILVVSMLQFSDASTQPVELEPEINETEGAFTQAIDNQPMNVETEFIERMPSEKKEYFKTLSEKKGHDIAPDTSLDLDGLNYNEWINFNAIENQTMAWYNEVPEAYTVSIGFEYNFEQFHYVYGQADLFWINQTDGSRVWMASQEDYLLLNGYDSWAELFFFGFAPMDGTFELDVSVQIDYEDQDFFNFVMANMVKVTYIGYSNYPMGLMVSVDQFDWDFNGQDDTIKFKVFSFLDEIDYHNIQIEGILFERVDGNLYEVDRREIILDNVNYIYHYQDMIFNLPNWGDYAVEVHWNFDGYKFKQSSSDYYGMGRYDPGEILEIYPSFDAVFDMDGRDGLNDFAGFGVDVLSWFNDYSLIEAVADMFFYNYTLNDWQWMDVQWIELYKWHSLSIDYFGFIFIAPWDGDFKLELKVLKNGREVYFSEHEMYDMYMYNDPDSIIPWSWNVGPADQDGDNHPDTYRRFGNAYYNNSGYHTYEVGFDIYTYNPSYGSWEYQEYFSLEFDGWDTGYYPYSVEYTAPFTGLYRINISISVDGYLEREYTAFERRLHEYNPGQYIIPYFTEYFIDWDGDGFEDVIGLGFDLLTNIDYSGVADITTNVLKYGESIGTQYDWVKMNPWETAFLGVVFLPDSTGYFDFEIRIYNNFGLPNTFLHFAYEFFDTCDNPDGFMTLGFASVYDNDNDGGYDMRTVTYCILVDFSFATIFEVEYYLYYINQYGNRDLVDQFKYRATDDGTAHFYSFKYQLPQDGSYELDREVWFDYVKQDHLSWTSYLNPEDNYDGYNQGTYYDWSMNYFTFNRDGQGVDDTLLFGLELYYYFQSESWITLTVEVYSDMGGGNFQHINTLTDRVKVYGVGHDFLSVLFMASDSGEFYFDYRIESDFLGYMHGENLWNMYLEPVDVNYFNRLGYWKSVDNDNDGWMDTIKWGNFFIVDYEGTYVDGSLVEIRYEFYNSNGYLVDIVSYQFTWEGPIFAPMEWSPTQPGEYYFNLILSIEGDEYPDYGRQQDYIGFLAPIHDNQSPDISGNLPSEYSMDVGDDVYLSVEVYDETLTYLSVMQNGQMLGTAYIGEKSAEFTWHLGGWDEGYYDLVFTARDLGQNEATYEVEIFIGDITGPDTTTPGDSTPGDTNHPSDSETDENNETGPPAPPLDLSSLGPSMGESLLIFTFAVIPIVIIRRRR
ncbi:MAG: hypothetical protein INQ03_24860 [Candidatus Heimdallarchaeota archaeon]|nr:hypothetical protein [Candidatus Heimdallarchaeota archaeon]